MLVQTQCHSHDTICIFLNIVLSGEEKNISLKRRVGTKCICSWFLTSWRAELEQMTYLLKNELTPSLPLS